MRALEDHLGVRLLNCTTRASRGPTPGERLSPNCARCYDEFQAAIELVDAFRETPTGRLRLTMPPPVGARPFVLAPVLARFLKHYPEIVLETTVELGLTDIVADRFDAGFRRGNLVARDMIAVRVTDDLHYRVVGARQIMWRATAGRTRWPICMRTTVFAIACPAADLFPGCSLKRANSHRIRHRRISDRHQ